ncbi:hypothetical protein [Psychroserpens damuponensis]|uniref:hypothetical protein n=1 Tax=Psychroserpens damuponensis TaxID=943936 RepID=UPI00058B75C9|nr:hypothetical protein [Psychroserpens damuponensis]
MKKIFELTYEFLMLLSKLTGFSYKEINIIVWFILIPLSWTFLIDKIKGKHYFKVGFSGVIILLLIGIKDFSEFSNQLFDISADFLRGFNLVGMDYTAASVVICLLVPLVVYGVLIRKAYFLKS